MGLGFTNRNSTSANAQEKAFMYDQQSDKPVNLVVGAAGWVKIVGGSIATIVLLSGLIWGAAMMFAGMASDDDVSTVRSRVEQIEKNDLVQTILLENIKNTLDKVEKKLDEVLSK